MNGQLRLRLDMEYISLPVDTPFVFPIIMTLIEVAANNETT